MTRLLPPRWRPFLLSAVSILFWLAVIDIGLSVVLHRVAMRHPTSGLVRYFDYGRSIEEKLATTIALPIGSPGAQVLAAGWLDPREWRTHPSRPAPGADLLVAVYGQSFANHAAIEAAARDGKLTLRTIGGPAAPLDHSYAAFLLDEPLRRADVVVVGILASSVARIGSMSAVDFTFENPAPFTSPRFTVEAGRLVVEAPAISTVADFRAAFVGRTPAWQHFRSQLAAHDRGFDPFVFDRTPLDGSNIVKLVRRGWVAHQAGYNAGVYGGAVGFDPASQPVRTMRAILPVLASQARAHGERLILLLEHDQGYGDALYQALKATLAEARIEYVSSHDLFSASDPHNFIADGHYTAEANGKLADALRRLIRSPAPAVAREPSASPLPTPSGAAAAASGLVK